MTQVIGYAVVLASLVGIMILALKISDSISKVKNRVMELPNKNFFEFEFASHWTGKDRFRYTPVEEFSEEIKCLRGEILPQMSDEVMLQKIIKYQGQTYKVVSIETSANMESVAELTIFLEAVQLRND